MRRLTLWVLTTVFVWVLVSRQTDIERLAETLARGQWQWVLIAGLLQVVYYLVYATVCQFAFRAVGIQRPLRNLVPVLLGSISINVLVPGAGMSGTALFVDDAARRGESPARAAAGVLLAITADLVTLATVLSAGMAYLFALHDLETYEMVGALLPLGLIGGLSGMLMIGLWLPSLLRGVRVLFLAFQHPVGLGPLVAGYAVGILFWVVSPKFHPKWSPRYLVYPGAASLPFVAIAILRADAGGR